MLSDCPKCWDTPCSCGYEYRDKTVKDMASFIARILQYRTKAEALEILNDACFLVANGINWKYAVKVD